MQLPDAARLDSTSAMRSSRWEAAARRAELNTMLRRKESERFERKTPERFTRVLVHMREPPWGKRCAPLVPHPSRSSHRRSFRLDQHLRQPSPDPTQPTPRQTLTNARSHLDP